MQRYHTIQLTFRKSVHIHKFPQNQTKISNISFNILVYICISSFNRWRKTWTEPIIFAQNHSASDEWQTPERFSRKFVMLASGH